MSVGHPGCSIQLKIKKMQQQTIFIKRKWTAMSKHKDEQEKKKLSVIIIKWKSRISGQIQEERQAAEVI